MVICRDAVRNDDLSLWAFFPSSRLYFALIANCVSGLDLARGRNPGPLQQESHPPTGPYAAIRLYLGARNGACPCGEISGPLLTILLFLYWALVCDQLGPALLQLLSDCTPLLSCVLGCVVGTERVPELHAPNVSRSLAHECRMVV